MRLACSNPSKKRTSMSILKFLSFILVYIPLIHSVDDSCPNSHCSNAKFLSLTYPFKLEGQQPRICSKYIDLKCSPQNDTILNLPSGDFYISDIFYLTKSISLYDPQDCLPKRLMSLDLSSSPFTAIQIESYSFYSCPITLKLFTDGFNPIECLSDGGAVTVASSSRSPAEMMESYGCITRVTVDIPVEQAHQFDGYGDFSKFMLKWDVPSCRECEEALDQEEDDSPSTPSRYIGLFILLVIWGFGCFLRLILSRCSANRTAASTTTGEVDMAAPQTATTAGAVPPQPTGGVHDDCYLKTTTISTFLEANDKGNSCSICLEEYSPQDTIRCLTVCDHYFHANCIDLWFQKNSSCPVCRTSILDVRL